MENSNYYRYLMYHISIGTFTNKEQIKAVKELLKMAKAYNNDRMEVINNGVSTNSNAHSVK